MVVAFVSSIQIYYKGIRAAFFKLGSETRNDKAQFAVAIVSLELNHHPNKVLTLHYTTKKLDVV